MSLEQRNAFFEKISKIDKPLFKPIKRKRDKIQVNKIRNEKGDLTLDTEEIQRIMRSYFKNLYSRKVENVKEMGNFLLCFKPLRRYKASRRASSVCRPYLHQLPVSITNGWQLANYLEPSKFNIRRDRGRLDIIITLNETIST